jgi:hypothetical protein
MLRACVHCDLVDSCLVLRPQVVGSKSIWVRSVVSQQSWMNLGIDRRKTIGDTQRPAA